MELEKESPSLFKRFSQAVWHTIKKNSISRLCFQVFIFSKIPLMILFIYLFFACGVEETHSSGFKTIKATVQKEKGVHKQSKWIYLAYSGWSGLRGRLNLIA